MHYVRDTRDDGPWPLFRKAALDHWSERLGEAMRHRAAIEQAKGMLMVTQGCSADDAFDLLVRASQRENVKLREIARRMVADVANRSRKGD